MNPRQPPRPRSADARPTAASLVVLPALLVALSALLCPTEAAAESLPPPPPVDAGSDRGPDWEPPGDPCPGARPEACEGARCPTRACTADQTGQEACVLAECDDPFDDPGCRFYCCDGQAWRYVREDPDPCGIPQPEPEVDAADAADGMMDLDGAADGDAMADAGEPAPPEREGSDGCAAGRPGSTGWLAGLGALLLASALRRRLG